MSATLALVNGRVLVEPSSTTTAEAVALAGDRVLATGTTEAIREHLGPRTEVVDLAGRLVLPAFGDAHVHALNGGLEMRRCNLLGLRTRSECLDAIARYSAGLAPDAWVLGGGWAMEAFPRGLPAAEDLDAACGHRAAFLPNRDHHSAWVSTAALELAGVDATTPDPADGRIERDESGRPVGVLHEGAMSLVSRLAPPASRDELRAALGVATDELASLGITFFQDACVGDARELGVFDTFDCYRDAAGDGTLGAEVVGALWWDRRRGLEQLPDLLGRREAASGGRFRATSVKIMLDGVCETYTAAMTEPYVGLGPGHEHHRGELFLSPEEVTAAVAALDAADFQVHFHALGDRAVHVGLDALEALPAERRGKGRHHLAHLQFVRPEDIARFQRLGVTANFQPLWACAEPQMEELTLPFVGPERATWQYRIASVLAAGGRVAFGSDWPVSSPDPLQEIHVAVNRRLSTRLGRAGAPETEVPFLAEEAIPVATAIAAFTEGVARVNGCEDRRGTLRVGKQADLVILDRDILAIPPAEIGETSVTCTVAGGRVVHGAP